MSYALTEQLHPYNFTRSLFRSSQRESSVTQPDLSGKLSLRLSGDRQSAVSDYRLHSEVLTLHLRPENQRLLGLLSDWYATPDELGDAWWEDFEEELAINRFHL